MSRQDPGGRSTARPDTTRGPCGPASGRLPRRLPAAASAAERNASFKRRTRIQRVVEGAGGRGQRVDHRLVARRGRAELDDPLDRGVERRCRAAGRRTSPHRRARGLHAGAPSPTAGRWRRPTVDTSVLPATIRSRPGGRSIALPGQRLADGVEAAAHVGPVITVTDRGVELRQVVALRLDLLLGLDSQLVMVSACTIDSVITAAHAPQRSAGVWTGASQSEISSSSSSSTVSDAPAISSEVM